MDYDKVIGAAIDWEIRNWQERQIDALNEVAFPLLSEKDDDLLKTITALNTAWGTTKVLMPPVNELATSAAIPLHILGQAQSKMTDAYKKYIDNINKAVSERYTNIRDALVNEIQAIARSFKGNSQGTRLINMLRDNVACPAGLDTENKVEVFYRELLFQSGMIVTDAKVIRQQTKDGFAKLLENVKMIYLASYHGPAWGSSGNLHLHYSSSGSKLPVRTNTLGLHGNSEQWQEWKSKGAKRFGSGTVYFGGFEPLRASKVFTLGHEADERKKQDKILANAYRMETKRFYGGHYGFDELYVSRKDDTDYSKPKAFTLPNKQLLGIAAMSAMDELRKRGVAN